MMSEKVLSGTQAVAQAKILALRARLAELEIVLKQVIPVLDRGIDCADYIDASIDNIMRFSREAKAVRTAARAALALPVENP